jgi:hypothetical protein
MIPPVRAGSQRTPEIDPAGAGSEPSSLKAIAWPPPDSVAKIPGEAELT